MHFLNVYHCFESVGRLVRAVGGEVSGTTDAETAYRQAIGKVRPIPPPAEGVAISFEDGPWGQYLLQNNIFEDIFVGVRPSDADTRAKWSSEVESAFEYVRNLLPDLGRLVDLLVTDVVLFESDRTGGGSASHLPGLVCMSPSPTWKMVDFAESLVHEAIHLNVFVADMVYGMYKLPTSTLAEDQYRVLSAVKIGEMRPLDKAFHSAVVAVPLMYMQHLRGETTLVDLFRSSLLDCSTGLMSKRETFTRYGLMLVEELHQFALSTDFDYVVSSISSPAYGSYKMQSA